jgi:TonB family protein
MIHWRFVFAMVLAGCGGASQSASPQEMSLDPEARQYVAAIKAKVNEMWLPSAALHKEGLSKDPNGASERTTVVRLVVASSGDLQNVSVTESSGVSVLDDEALRATKAAQPFGPVPRSLLTRSGTFTFEIGLVLEMDNADSPQKNPASGGAPG